MYCKFYGKACPNLIEGYVHQEGRCSIGVRKHYASTQGFLCPVCFGAEVSVLKLMTLHGSHIHKFSGPNEKRALTKRILLASEAQLKKGIVKTVIESIPMSELPPVIEGNSQKAVKEVTAAVSSIFDWDTVSTIARVKDDLYISSISDIDETSQLRIVEGIVDLDEIIESVVEKAVKVVKVDEIENALLATAALVNELGEGTSVDKPVKKRVKKVVEKTGAVGSDERAEFEALVKAHNESYAKQKKEIKEETNKLRQAQEAFNASIDEREVKDRATDKRHAETRESFRKLQAEMTATYKRQKLEIANEVSSLDIRKKAVLLTENVNISDRLQLDADIEQHRVNSVGRLAGRNANVDAYIQHVREECDSHTQRLTDLSNMLL